MKKETLLTVVVFLGVGFLGGYVYSARRNSNFREDAAASARKATPAPAPAQSNSSSSPDGVGMDLPQGHPAVNAAEIVHF
ncbi:MAG: hypothetical protein ACRD3O_02235, partial [Terriglobia bacterium]